MEFTEQKTKSKSKNKTNKKASNTIELNGWSGVSTFEYMYQRTNKDIIGTETQTGALCVIRVCLCVHTSQSLVASE